MKKQISRRDFLKLAGGAVVTVAGASLLPQFLRKTLMAEQVVKAAGEHDLFFAGTDGWMHLPGSLAPWHPDSYAEPPFTTYIFGFRNLTGLNPDFNNPDDPDWKVAISQKQKAQHNAPLWWVDQYDPTPGQQKDFKVLLTNLGLALRPDLTDAHTLHWHGFRNVIPFFDGEPTGSVAVKVSQHFTYVYRPHDPGTYMYHCHVEDIEHVTMGMTGIVFVRPLQNKYGNDAGAPVARAALALDHVDYLNPLVPLGYAYNDGVAVGAPGSTAYDREFPMFLSEVWCEGHWNDAHIQESSWDNFKADYSLLNGRVYPDTLAPNGSGHDADYELIAPAGHPELQYQPHSSLVECNSGEKVLLRFANLGFREAAMTFAGLTVKVVGRDATPMLGRDSTDTSYETDTLLMGAGESYDVIFTAPAPGTYLLYNRRYTQDDDQATQGQRTEIHVYAAGTLPAQDPMAGFGI
jgi:FtsP/CotA-like multicopper oxidase with cupredoxin domain